MFLINIFYLFSFKPITIIRTNSSVARVLFLNPQRPEFKSWRRHAHFFHEKNCGELVVNGIGYSKILLMYIFDRFR